LLLVARIDLGLGWLALLVPPALVSGRVACGIPPAGFGVDPLEKWGQFLHLVVGGEYLPGGSRWNIRHYSGSEGRDAGRVSVGMTTAGQWKQHFGGCTLGLGGAGRKVADWY
jgi:hypothetical protein